MLKLNLAFFLTFGYRRTFAAVAAGAGQCDEIYGNFANLDSTKLVNLYLIQHKQSSWILTSQTGGHWYLHL